MVKCLDLIRMADIRSRWIDHVTDSLAWSCSRFAVVPFEYALAVLINLIAILDLVLSAADDWCIDCESFGLLKPLGKRGEWFEVVWYTFGYSTLLQHVNVEVVNSRNRVEKEKHRLQPIVLVYDYPNLQMTEETLGHPLEPVQFENCMNKVFIVVECASLLTPTLTLQVDRSLSLSKCDQG